MCHVDRKKVLKTKSHHIWNLKNSRESNSHLDLLVHTFMCFEVITFYIIWDITSLVPKFKLCRLGWWYAVNKTKHYSGYIYGCPSLQQTDWFIVFCLLNMNFWLLQVFNYFYFVLNSQSIYPFDYPYEIQWSLAITR